MAPQNEHVAETPYFRTHIHSSKLAANDQVEAVEISYGVGGSVHPALVLRVE
jgi:hypothetical protein